MPDVRALLFDLGNVLIEVDAQRCFEHWAQFSPHTALQMSAMPVLQKEFEQHEVGELSDQQFFEFLRGLMSLDTNDTEIQHGWDAMIGEQIEPTIEMIRQCQGKIPCSMFSNTNPSHQVKWSQKHAGIMGLFDQLFVSSEIALRKPDVEAYANVCDAMQLPAENILFFDDRADNIAGARAAGLQAVQVASSDDVAIALGPVKSALMAKLHSKMTAEQFNTGYWYATELKAFAQSLGLRSYSRQRKDQLEARILLHLTDGEQPEPKSRAATKGSGSDKLALDTPVVQYVSNKTTKQFILAKAKKRCPSLPNKSGRWYWLNRWREQQLEQKIPLSYGDLVDHMVELCTREGRLPQIPSARFNNFISDFLADQRGDRSDALAAWEELKKSKLPKTYSAWKGSAS